MSRAIQIRRGNADEHKEFTGLEGEVTYDTTGKTLRVHDGATPGGIALARADALPAGGGTLPADIDYVVEWQTPTSDNEYTWYRKYKSGWVEQGGRTSAQTITMPIEMSDANYHVFLCGECQTANNNINLFAFRNRTSTAFTVQGNILNASCQSSNANGSVKYWRVCGLAA